MNTPHDNYDLPEFRDQRASGQPQQSIAAGAEILAKLETCRRITGGMEKRFRGWESTAVANARAHSACFVCQEPIVDEQWFCRHPREILIGRN